MPTLTRLPSTTVAATPVPASPPQPARILVIDDDAAVCRMIEMALNIAGHEVVTVQQARAGLSYLETNSVDLVITDLVMPDVEGIEIIMRMNHAHPTVPIVAISGEGAEGPEEYLSIARLLGAHRTLCKPFDCRELLQAINELLRRK